ncbi:Qat anti-phage system TatD family nuclease QatD [Mycolicibacterium sp. P9-22]|uniref:Qat anti-phage system TatD family nuclease QatD n=1 Tax=Mycolicibacterium sp. P9-22 TaxID=2024613 RepID=UPI0011EC35C0|nr:Qat anti-phage system TatD family nuclease QatD [Mycolicibacterium sp. P9-22]KAA0114397.1 TatD family deoxyribonuclease [Mycolicibacterium sp. P9-22]
MIDFHCHLDLYRTPHEVAEEAHRLGVGVLSVTTTPSAWPGTYRLSEGRSTIKTALGLHPQLANERKHELRLFDRYLPDATFVGEVGLDGSPEHRSSWSDQELVFDHVLRSCEEAQDKIVSIHSRRAAGAVLDSLDKFGGIRAPILHWFSGTRAELRRAVGRGCWFSVGAAMLAGAKGRALVHEMPRDRVLLETDGPFAQVNRNALRPIDVAIACRSLADLWSTDYEDAELMIGKNERTLLRLSTEKLDPTVDPDR